MSSSYPTPGARRTARRRAPNRLQVAKAEEIARLRDEGLERVGQLSERDLFVAGIALYAGEGSKTPGEVRFTNTDPRMVVLFLAWFRRFFEPDETRLRVRLYLHEGLDLDAANAFWSELTGIPCSQFRSPHRAVADPTIRQAKHVHGCASVGYSSTSDLRRISGLMDALLTSPCFPG